YAELGLVVIPDPHLTDSNPLRAIKVKHHWRQNRAARVGLLTAHRFDVLEVGDGPEQRAVLDTLVLSGTLSSCFGQGESTGGTTHLLFATDGLHTQRIGLARQGVRVIGRPGYVDVTPSVYRWLWVDIDLYDE